jgi:hypothetical protein
MRTISFDSKDEFNKEMDGKIFAIGNAKNTGFFCNLLEEELTFLLKAGEIECVCESEKTFKGKFSEYALRDRFRTHETLSRAVRIEILDLEYKF